MKKSTKNLVLVLTITTLLSSCYTLTYSVGNGPQKGIEKMEKNHYFVYGLAAGKTSDPTKMAADVTDYEVTVSHTFIDGLLNVLTFGIYTPTTTTVTK